MLSLIQFFVYLFVLPVIYVLIVLFDANLVIRAPSRTARLQMLFGVILGVLLTVIIVMLDQTTNMFKLGPLPDPSKIDQVWPFVVIAFLLGMFVLFVIHVLLRAQQILAFIVTFTIVAMVTSIYFILTISDIRSIVAVASLGFLAGIITYCLLFPSIVSLLISGIPAQAQEPQKPNW